MKASKTFQNESFDAMFLELKRFIRIILLYLNPTLEKSLVVLIGILKMDRIFWLNLL